MSHVRARLRQTNVVTLPSLQIILSQVQNGGSFQILPLLVKPFVNRINLAPLPKAARYQSPRY